MDGSACQRRSPLDRTALEIGYRELPEIETPQVCKYDAPRRRRLGRVTTERRESVGAEREPREREIVVVPSGTRCPTSQLWTGGPFSLLQPCCCCCPCV